VSSNDPTIVYFLIAYNSRGLVNVYKSTNSGKSILGYYSDGSGSNTGQGWYDLISVW